MAFGTPSTLSGFQRCQTNISAFKLLLSGGVSWDTGQKNSVEETEHLLETSGCPVITGFVSATSFKN